VLLFSRWYAGGMPGQLNGDSKWKCYDSLFRSPLISRLIISKLSMYEASVLCGFRVIPHCQTQPAIARYSKRCKTRSGHVWNGRVPGKWFSPQTQPNSSRSWTCWIYIESMTNPLHRFILDTPRTKHCLNVLDHPKLGYYRLLQTIQPPLLMCC